MNDIITNGAEIKSRIISEINNAKKCVCLVMAWLTDKDIAKAIISAKERNVSVDIILSSNAQNETVRQMFKNANIYMLDKGTKLRFLLFRKKRHACCRIGNEIGMMHHKFCLIDNRISINASCNYFSNNNTENIQVSDDVVIYRQLLSDFKRLKYNTVHNHNTYVSQIQYSDGIQSLEPTSYTKSFSDRLTYLVYSQINTDAYKKQGYDKSKECKGNIDIFKAELNNIKEQIRMDADDEQLNSKKNILISNIQSVFETTYADLENEKQNKINAEKVVMT